MPNRTQKPAAKTGPTTKYRNAARRRVNNGNCFQGTLRSDERLGHTCFSRGFLCLAVFSASYLRCIKVNTWSQKLNSIQSLLFYLCLSKIYNFEALVNLIYVQTEIHVFKGCKQNMTHPPFAFLFSLSACCRWNHISPVLTETGVREGWKKERDTGDLKAWQVC